MRRVTKDDLPALDAITLKTLQIAYPDLGIEDHRGLADQFGREEVVMACTDKADAFILAERLSPAEWTVRFLMPLDMFADTGKALIAFAIAEEHARRPFLATTKCFAMLNKISAVERGTADAYKIIANADSKEILDATGVARATELSMLAPDMAAKFGIPIVFPAVIK